MSDLRIELSSTKYDLNFAKARTKYLDTENERLASVIDKLQKDLDFERLLNKMKLAVRDNNVEPMKTIDRRFEELATIDLRVEQKNEAIIDPFEIPVEYEEVVDLDRESQDMNDTISKLQQELEFEKLGRAV